MPTPRTPDDAVEAAVLPSNPSYVSETDITGEHWLASLGPSPPVASGACLNAVVVSVIHVHGCVNDEQGDLAPTERAGVPPLPEAAAIQPCPTRSATSMV